MATPLDKVLVLTGGSVRKLEDFKEVEKASFSDIKAELGSGKVSVNGKSLEDFEVIYFRLVGKSLEIATFVANFAKEKGIRVVDRIYTNSQLLPASLGKIVELEKLVNAGVPIPKTVFGDFTKLSFPYVVKSTTGQRAREVWKVDSEKDLEDLKKNKFEKGKHYFAQEYMPNAKRIRVLVVGKKALGAIVRQTKWNKDGTKKTLSPVPDDLAKLSVKTAQAVDLEICGVDVLENNKDRLIIEANAAPSWKLIKDNCDVEVEKEILKYLTTNG